MTKDEKQRRELADRYARDIWVAVTGTGEAPDTMVAVLADVHEPLGRMLMTALGRDCEDTDIGVDVHPREDTIAALEPVAPEIAAGIATATPMRITVVVAAFGSWTVLAMGRNVGQA